MARVAVAMSGGVDSAVAAALLVDQGHVVVGLTMNLRPGCPPEQDEGFKACCGGGAIGDARAVAQRLAIRHYILNMREEFERAVIDEFCDEYARGRTPNPCIACNRAIKFSLLLRKVRAMGLDYLATGHYARVRHDEAAGRFLLLRARARRLGLRVADKPDSQEICFVPRGHYVDVVARRRPEAARPGPILDRSGRQIGTHSGLARFTIGQRRGLGIAHGRPLYVAGIDLPRNAVIVGEEEDLLVGEITAREVNWIGGAGPGRPLPGAGRARPARKKKPATG